MTPATASTLAGWETTPDQWGGATYRCLTCGVAEQVFKAEIAKGLVEETLARVRHRGTCPRRTT